VFIALALFIIAAVGPLLIRAMTARSTPGASSIPQLWATQHSAFNTRHYLASLPWWGWGGVLWTAVWWVLAWTRFSWMAPVQAHTFTPLWLGYIVVMNGWTFARTGRCMMLHRPRYFLSLFPLSAVFWWFFEYLNRFVQNWYYVGVVELSPLEYFFRATVPFSTVLPAVIGTMELMTSIPRLSAGLERYQPVRLAPASRAGWIVLLLSSTGLVGLGPWPNYLFPLVWVAPLLVITGLQVGLRQETILADLGKGDWRVVWQAALAALICGVFWELWNWKSLAHWQYTVPFVQRFHLFEMPLLGYAGYLPFGLECLVVADLCLSRKFSGGVAHYCAQAPGTKPVTM
jgi:hypothetical protein